MKATGIVLWIVGLVLFIVFLSWGFIYSLYLYDVEIGQNVSLADDASTAVKKLEYLEKFSVAVRAKITRNQARFIFKRERLTRDKQLEILETLQTRLREAVSMDPTSFEYQTAMGQITGQEFDHALGEINGIMSSCWLRQSPFAIFCLWVSWWMFGALVCVGYCIVAKDCNWIPYE